MRLLLVFWLMIVPAAAQVGQVALAPYAPAISYTGPVDAAGTPAILCISVRGCASSYATGTNQSLIAQRASDSETCNFNIALGGSLGNSSGCSGSDNGKSLATFCSGTTCTATSGTDQTGTSAPFTGTMGLPPGCDGSIACFSGNGTSEALNNDTANISQAQPYTMAAVLYMPAGISSPGAALATYPVSVGTQDAAACTPNSANCATAYAGLGQQSIPMTSNAWHSLLVVFNGAASTYSVDCQTPVTFSVNPGADALTSDAWLGAFHYAQYYNGYEPEALIFPGALSGTQQNAVGHNMHVYFSTASGC